MLAVDLGEVPAGARLAAEELDHPHAADVLLQEGVDAGDLHPHLAEALAGPRLEPQGEQEEQRQDRQAPQGEVPVEQEKHGDDAEEQEEVAENRHQAGGEQLVERLDVGGRPGHQAADRLAVEEADRQLLEVAEHVAPQVRHHPLAHQPHHVALGEERAEDQHQVEPVEGRQVEHAVGRRQLGCRGPASWLASQRLAKAGFVRLPAPLAGRPRRRRAVGRRRRRRLDEEVERGRGGQRPDQLEAGGNSSRQASASAARPRCGTT